MLILANCCSEAIYGAFRVKNTRKNQLSRNQIEIGVLAAPLRLIVAHKSQQDNEIRHVFLQLGDSQY